MGTFSVLFVAGSFLFAKKLTKEKTVFFAGLFPPDNGNPENLLPCAGVYTYNMRRGWIPETMRDCKTIGLRS
jgi:hypothetical protein